MLSEGSGKPPPGVCGARGEVNPGQGLGGRFVEGQAGSRRGSGCARPRGEGGEPGAARVRAVGEKIPLLPTDRAPG